MPDSLGTSTLVSRMHFESGMTYCRLMREGLVRSSAEEINSENQEDCNCSCGQNLDKVTMEPEMKKTQADAARCVACQRLHEQLLVELVEDKEEKCSRLERHCYPGCAVDKAVIRGRRMRCWDFGEERWLRCASSVVRWRTLWKKLIWIVPLLLLTLASPCTAEFEHLFNTTISPPAERQGTVCQSVDVRNHVSDFQKLNGCRVVEGFVQILLMDKADDEAFENLVFPDLVEITGYLLLYRVQGLRSIGQLFPNLTVIRGHNLFLNYAIVVFEMMHLQEIGLYSLTDVLRGGVRFEKNPLLCNANSVDWDIIGKAGQGDHMVLGSRKRNECPVCEKNCPVKKTERSETLCWNKLHCQKICDRCDEGIACDDKGDCCHPSCLGGCTGPTSEDCIVCRDVLVDERKCLKQCPPDMYEFQNRRCIKQEECRKMRKPRETSINLQSEEIELSSKYPSHLIPTLKEYPYKPFGNSCLIDCPAGYEELVEDGEPTCKACNGPCLKACPGTNVDSIANAQKLRGCTHISGNLEIQIRGGHNVVKELEENLGLIDTINGSLKIVRSTPLVSLNFLKSLKEVRGNLYSESNQYTVSVLDNENLMELFDRKNDSNSIRLLSKNGTAKILFHYNPKLCLDKIETFRKASGLKKPADFEVSTTSNGDKIACNITELKTNITLISSNAAIIHWEMFKHHDQRSILSYVVHYTEAPFQNITMYDGRDACGSNGWKMYDVPPDEPIAEDYFNQTDSKKNNTSNLMVFVLTQLKPYTQYAYYVKTYTISAERSGAQSKIEYFKTLPGTPMMPKTMAIWSNASDVMVVQWLPPTQSFGNLTHYRIIGRWEPDDPANFAQRDYCTEPMLLLDRKPLSILAEEERKKAEGEIKLSEELDKSEQCKCPGRGKDPAARDQEASNSIAFEDFLQNQVYIKRSKDYARKRRNALPNHDYDIVFDHDRGLYQTNVSASNQTSDDQSGSPLDLMENGYYVAFERVVPSTNLTFVMRNLRHFASYNIEILACREPEPNATEKTCSAKSMRNSRTLPLPNADDIPSASFRVNTLSANDSTTTVELQWDEPPQPNGLIVTYQIEYRRVDVQNIKPTIVCITTDKFRKSKNTYLLRDLQSGNYSVKIHASSFAGDGAYTDIKYFYVPDPNAISTFWKVFLPITAVFVILAIGSSVLYMCKRKFMRAVPSMRLIATVNPEYVSTVYIPDEWEVPRKKINLMRELGNGSFGMVYEGLAKDVVKGKPEVRCAVKTVNENATDRERIEFLNEASVMKGFNTHHVVRLLGVVSQGQPTLVVMELMVNGDLKTYLRSHRPEEANGRNHQPPTLKRILQMAIEIADGMSYLTAKKFVHRDLAARNCMVSDDLTVKIGDFGMTRDIYETDYYRKGTKGLLPVRWMAPESLKDGVFTSYSDVWSYGVVLWEMVTLASQPYQGLSNDQVLKYVIEGGVMERPENCPDSLYLLMRQTWHHKSAKRPSFIDIVTMLLSEIDIKAFERVSFFHSVDGVEARNQNNCQFPRIDKDMELLTLQDLREEEIEEEEHAPLRQDFGDFSSFEPIGSSKNSSNSRFGMEPFHENSKVSLNFHDMNSSKAPLKAGFEDFDGVSTGSITSSKDALNLPFTEDSCRSRKSSPFVQKKSLSKGNVSQCSLGKSSISPQSTAKQIFLDSPSISKPLRREQEYENRSPEATAFRESNELALHDGFPDLEPIDMEHQDDFEIDSKHSVAEYLGKPETMNNGYIGSATT